MLMITLSANVSSERPLWYDESLRDQKRRDALILAIS